MTEAMIVEAIRAAGAVKGLDPMAGVQQVADSTAVAKFEAAMEARGPTEIPFASQVAETFLAAQANYQEMLHRVQALTAMSRTHALSAAELSELQYEVANLSFQQEIVTNVAKKASDAISTLVKNG